ncbi:MAG: hypothetical protein HY868_16380 [Chloroflexi bacterium]|nr:hypothetical protein [Chloroflexota bacterium]
MEAMIETFIEWLGLIGMFALRLGIPIALTILVGRWLEKKMRPPEENGTRKNEMERRTPTKVIRLHCWDFKHCDSTTRAKCAATKHPDLPCWLALQADGHKVREDCFSCALYKPQTKVA